MQIFKERPGVLADDPVWVCLVNERLFIADKLWKLIWLCATEWNDERHLVG